jgi:hypothetical protein
LGVSIGEGIDPTPATIVRIAQSANQETQTITVE